MTPVRTEILRLLEEMLAAIRRHLGGPKVVAKAEIPNLVR
jgi:hypothetical protein